MCLLQSGAPLDTFIRLSMDDRLGMLINRKPEWHANRLFIAVMCWHGTGSVKLLYRSCAVLNIGSGGKGVDLARKRHTELSGLIQQLPREFDLQRKLALLYLDAALNQIHARNQQGNMCYVNAIFLSSFCLSQGISTVFLFL